MPEPNVTKARAALGAELRRLRKMAGRAQDGLGDGATKLSQSTVSRVESGRRIPTREQADTWLVYATTGERQHVEQLLAAAYRETRTYDDLLAGQKELQHLVADEDRAAATVRSYSPIVLPGLLQTAEYATRVFGLGSTDVAASVAARLQRQAVLHEPGRRFEFLIPERLLRCDVAPGTRAAQLWHLQSAATLEQVDLGVVPDQAVPVLAWSGFVLRVPADGSPEYAAVELIEGRHTAADASSVARYRDVWEKLSEAAWRGDEALRAIARARQ